jgi:thiol-disulfide isomerase/thioredoxin
MSTCQTHDPSRRGWTGWTGALALIGALLLALPALPAAAQGALRGLGGERLAEADLARGTTIIVVWASWSPRGRDIDRRVNALAARWGSDARVVTVNFQEDRATVEEFLRGKNLRAPVFLDTDGAFSKKNAVTNLPGLLVIKDGSTAFRGKLPDDADAIIGEIVG